ncbi:long-chain fatty acid-CoA ligase, partial [Coemansia spiralis]
MERLYSLYVPGTGGASETGTRRYPTAVTRGLTTAAPPHVTTVYDAFLHRLAQEPDKRTMGRRRVLRVDEERRGDGRLWSRFELSDYEWLTYREIASITRALGAGLAHIAGDAGVRRVAIYAPTSREWTLCMLGCFSQGMQVVTAYDTLGDEGLLHAVNQAQARVLVVKADQLPVVARVADRVQTVRTIVYYQDHCGMSDRAREALEQVRQRFARVEALDAVQALGEQHPRDLQVATADDTALVMYTSGTTGPPKGALIAHGGLLAICGAIHELVPA